MDTSYLVYLSYLGVSGRCVFSCEIVTSIFGVGGRCAFSCEIATSIFGVGGRCAFSWEKVTSLGSGISIFLAGGGGAGSLLVLD